MNRTPRSTLVGTATYTGPPSLGFYPNRRYWVTIRGDRLEATDKEAGGSTLRNVYTVGGFLCNWKDVEIHQITTKQRSWL